jgi:hypothetical protein
VPVPLSILVVFSEPMDSTTLHPATVQLLRNGYVVPGRVEVADDLLAVSFTPAEALALNAAYVLNVDSQVSDLDGEVLRGSEQVDFTTTSEPSPLAGEYVRVTPWFFPGDAPRVVLNAYLQSRVPEHGTYSAGVHGPLHSDRCRRHSRFRQSGVSI